MVQYSITNANDWNNWYLNNNLTSDDTTILNFIEESLILTVSNFPNGPKLLNGSTFNGNNKTLEINSTTVINWSGVFDISLSNNTIPHNTIENLKVLFTGSGTFNITATNALLFGFSIAQRLCRVIINGLILSKNTNTTIGLSNDNTTIFWCQTPTGSVGNASNLIATDVQIGEPTLVFSIPITINRGILFSNSSLNTINTIQSSMTNLIIYASGASGSPLIADNFTGVDKILFNNVFIKLDGTGSLLRVVTNIQLNDVSYYNNNLSTPISVFNNINGLEINRMFVKHNSIPFTDTEFVNIQSNCVINNFGSDYQTNYVPTGNINFTDCALISSSVPDNTLAPWRTNLPSGFSFDTWTFSNNNLPIITLMNITPYKAGQYVSNTGNPELDITLICFEKGTEILTSSGIVLVENIKKGDLLITSTGQLTRVINCNYFKTFTQVYTITRDYFSPGKPYKDLTVSPDHVIYHDDKAHHVKCLSKNLEEKDIILESRNVELYHFETENYLQDKIIANGLEAETWGRQFRGKISWDCNQEECVMTILD